jgi:hypothetical protein
LLYILRDEPETRALRADQLGIVPPFQAGLPGELPARHNREQIHEPLAGERLGLIYRTCGEVLHCSLEKSPRLVS